MKYLIGLCVLTCSIVPGFGTTISFATPSGDQGITHTYGGISATAYGANSPAGAPPHLFGKNDGGDENGVGLTTDPSGQHEITIGDFIQLDVSSLIGTQLTVVMGSTTDGEAWSFFASNSALATSGTAVMSGSDENSFTFTPTLKYLDVTSTNGNVLLSSISYTQSAPEPVSFALVGSGLLGVFFIRRRKTGPR